MGNDFQNEPVAGALGDSNTSAENVELTPKGQTVNRITTAAVTVLGALLKAGLIGSGIANPAFLGAAVLGSLLPSIFAKKKKAVVIQAPQPLGLMASESVAPPPRVFVAADKTSKGAAIGYVLLQAAGLLTAVAAWADQLPSFLPLSDKNRAFVTMGGAFITAIVPGLQKLGILLRGEVPTS